MPLIYFFFAPLSCIAVRFAATYRLKIATKLGILVEGKLLVSIQFDSSTATSRFFVAPDRAVPWRDVMRFYLVMVFVSFGIAIAFAVSGLWMVLPFAGAEMLVLGIAFYVVARRGTYWQACCD